MDAKTTRLSPGQKAANTRKRRDSMKAVALDKRNRMLRDIPARLRRGEIITKGSDNVTLAISGEDIPGGVLSILEGRHSIQRNPSRDEGVSKYIPDTAHDYFIRAGKQRERIADRDHATLKACREQLIGSDPLVQFPTFLVSMMEAYSVGGMANLAKHMGVESC